MHHDAHGMNIKLRNPDPIVVRSQMPSIYNTTLGYSYSSIFRERKKEGEKEEESKREKRAMGEKEGKEDKKKENKEEKPKEEKKEGKGGEKKKEDGAVTVVLKLDIHCEGCALKIKKSVKNFEGVDAVSTDMANNKLTVIGRVDPWTIRERVETKTRKKVELISPANAPKKDSAPKDAEPKKAQPESKDQKKPGDKKAKEPAVSTVVLKIRLHCDGCIQRIRKTILRIKGVETVNVDSQKDLVTVKGTMDPNGLPPYLKGKLKRGVEIVPQKKESAGGGGGGGGGGDKKEKGGDGGGEKKDKGGDSGEKKDKGGDNKGKDGGGEKKGAGKEGGGDQMQAAAGPTVMEANKMEHYGGGYGYGYGGSAYGYGGGAPYRMDMVHAPQMFSDENPNACSVM